MKVCHTQHVHTLWLHIWVHASELCPYVMYKVREGVSEQWGFSKTLGWELAVPQRNIGLCKWEQVHIYLLPSHPLTLFRSWCSLRSGKFSAECSEIHCSETPPFPYIHTYARRTSKRTMQQCDIPHSSGSFAGSPLPSTVYCSAIPSLPSLLNTGCTHSVTRCVVACVCPSQYGLFGDSSDESATWSWHTQLSDPQWSNHQRAYMAQWVCRINLSNHNTPL